jgi:hypothetical protein
VGALGEFVAMEFKGVGDAAEEGGAGFAAGLRVAGEGFGGQAAGAVEFLRCGGTEDGLDGFAGLGSESLEAGAIAGAALRADEGESGEFHDTSRISSNAHGEGWA